MDVTARRNWGALALNLPLAVHGWPRACALGERKSARVAKQAHAPHICIFTADRRIQTPTVRRNDTTGLATTAGAIRRRAVRLGAAPQDASPTVAALLRRLDAFASATDEKLTDSQESLLVFLA